ncbi:Protein asteroid [Pseudolycoriella hygida]|uniref:Protein asteroid n=1 Tax=Pseudolycoriella hygida TaxID=35572 RepID=A0A9Q0N8S9_9DIPT|nr:Protein asteroid [Pseudolycoriella hygida]
MGVRGLTSYIAENAEKYLEPYELHDCDLVIDGDSLASNLYSWHSQCNSAFGGDYDQYSRCVVNFFGMLEKCNVTPYVLLDGGYERKKLETVRQRLRSKIAAVKHINPFHCIPLYPLMLREVFVEAVRSTGCRVMRCLFEADDEVSMLARKLNCPVLSYDSDFYIHNVRYIPSITLTFRVHKKKIPKKIRNNKSTETEETPSSYCYLDCAIYTVSNLVRNELNKEMLPLFATLLGNDYINGSMFRKFYVNVSLKNIGKRYSPQQRRIIALLRWLKDETIESAITKVLSRFAKEKRPWMLQQIVVAMGGYNRENSLAYKFFQIDDMCTSEPPCDSVESFYQTSLDMIVDTEDEDEEEEGYCESGSDEDMDCNEEESDKDLIEDGEECTTASIEEAPVPDATTPSFEPPDWVTQKFIAAELPRFIMDLLHLKLYVNSPQIENFLLNDSNAIALPILRLIFTLLHHPEPKHFHYLTRVLRISNVHSKKIETIPLREPFDPMVAKNFQIFEEIFQNFDRNLSTIANFPENLKLFVLAMIYLSEKNRKLTSPFYHSLLIGWLLLSKVDEDIKPATRDSGSLHKKFGSILDATPDEIEIDDEITIESITINDSVFFLRNVISLFEISDKMRRKHTEFSSTIVHQFSEFQAIVFNLNCLNSLVNKPFEPIMVSKSFNGTFLYNMYVNLRDRPNIDHYIRHHVFRDCSRYYSFYSGIVNTCQSVISCLTEASDKSKKGKATRNFRRNLRKQKLKTTGYQEEKLSVEAFDDVDSEDSEVEFSDSNNKFATLLNFRKVL